MVLAYGVIDTGEMLGRAKLLVLEDNPAHHELSGLLLVCTVKLESILDCVANLCQRLAPPQRLAPLESPHDIRFHDYPFVRSEVHWIDLLQRGICALQFRGGTFFDLAKEPDFLRIPVEVRAHETTGFLGVHDDGGKCYLYDVLLPIHSCAAAMVTRLCLQLEQQAPVFPSLGMRV